MAYFRNIKELTRTLYQGQKLLFDMFQKRKTISVKYDDAVETLEGKEDSLKRMIKFGVIIQSGNNLELDGTYQEFFEKILAVNEEISIASVKENIDSLKLNIASYLAAYSMRQPQFLRQIRHIFSKINQNTRRNVLDLKRNVEHTYKQEPNFKIKELRLKAFDEKATAIKELITKTETLIDDEAIFFSTVQDIGLKETIAEVKNGLKESAHGLISIKSLIIDYLNRIQYQSRIVKKVRKLKYLRDQLLINEGTDIKNVIENENAVWLEPRTTFSTKVSIDFLRNEDGALEFLANVRRKLNKSTAIKNRCASTIDPQYLEEQKETTRAFDHRLLAEAFSAQSDDLFSFIWNYRFAAEVNEEERLVLFLQLASQFYESLRFTDTFAKKGNYEYPLIYPL
ncbi:MAG: hypothetical protein K1W14_10050 [Muribaculaceae bacterium]